MSSRPVNITGDTIAHMLRNKAKEDGCTLQQDKIHSKVVCFDFKVTLLTKQLLHKGFKSRISTVRFLACTKKKKRHKEECITKTFKWL